MKQKHQSRRLAQILKELLVVSLLFNFQFSIFNSAWAQMKGGVPVKVSNKTQMVNGKRYYVHVVDQGQTVYAISRAYGLKEVEAITKKDIHFLQIGDTVWLPCKGQRLPDGTVAPPATGSAEPATEAGMRNGQATSQQHTAVNTDVRQQQAERREPAQPETPLGPTAEIRQRVNPQSVVVSLMMPFNLSQMDKISTSKFDVEQRGKTVYKSLEFIQFYEGLLLGLEQLEKMGYNVVLNVVDVEENTKEAVDRAFYSHKVAESDLLIALLTRQPFERVSELAREARLFVVNPVSDRQEIVRGNPYVFKCLPSVEARAREIVGSIRSTLPGSEVFILHSGAKGEKNAIQALTSAMEAEGNMHYTLVDWAKAQRLTTMLKEHGRAAVVSVYDQDKAKNRIYVSQLLNKLSSIKKDTPYLYTFDDWTTQYADVDFGQLQNLNYHTFYADWLLTDERQRAFVDRFREEYKTEPTNAYAGMANDIIIYFVCGLQQRGTAFFESPAIPQPAGVMYPIRFSRARQDWGFENGEALLHRMSDYQFIVVK